VASFARGGEARQVLWRSYLSEAINKVGAMNRVEAARIARAKGWL
jgi:hypothetical protein